VPERDSSIRDRVASRLGRNIVRATSGAALLAAMLLAVHRDASDPATGAILRIAVRTTAGTAEVCRRVSQEELEKLPVHMRRPEVCEPHAVPYRLLVRTGSAILIDRVYTASGIHGDRPLALAEDLSVEAGRQDVSIRFAPAATAAGAAPTSSEFLFEGSIDFPEGRIRVATLETKSEAFEIR
jgi:hypothetical protein